MKWLILVAALLVFSALFVARAARAGDLPEVGKPAPDFRLPDQHGKLHALQDYRGQYLVLYFYPKDDTPGCTQEACAFRDDLNQITAMGAQVVGVSVDNSNSHAEFATKYHLPFPLLSDKSGAVADSYGALLNLGILKMARRFTFLIDPEGNLVKAYLAVETSRHSQEIIADLKKLTAERKL
ncbi:MAG TPA: peroxiredoxin [Gallionella sp.]|nr:MAG: peroxiredoxin [Gallionellales bacterium CG_4_8_14_3_um_filter_54_18]PJB06342.1 MAG: peroxiredoxin [Hydrogenophilales bacterium CG_4_9_14_3_um_filter_59_35]PJC05003.1 MAG: peroxiredoxin [Gallionellales bacterium CG_4_9_14_0_8_um_filter_55_61]HCJ51300.1 peroxiredoxin [Gallionella sp.]